MERHAPFSHACFAASGRYAWAILPGAVLRSVAVIAALPIAVTVFATAGLIAFATWRIDGNGMAFAREERQ